MAEKKSTNKQMKSEEKREARRSRMLQIVIIGFSILLILSMILSLFANT